MKIGKDLMQTMKDVPNSPYSVVSPYFLFHSNKLEGSTFSESELGRLFDSNMIVGNHSADDVMETINSIKVLDHIVDSLGEPITHEFLIRLNAMLLRGTTADYMGYIGHYKELSNFIRGSGVQVALPSDVRPGISELLRQWEESDKDLSAICHFHVRFEHIHPFQDGNGRIGRFLMLKQCIENDVDLFAIEEQVNKPYRAWLEVAQTQGNEQYLLGVLEGAQEMFELKMQGEGITDEVLEQYRKEVPRHTLACNMLRSAVSIGINELVNSVGADAKGIDALDRGSDIDGR